MEETYPIVRLGVLENNTLTCYDGEILTVYPYSIILEYFNNKFAYFQIDSKGIINNAVLYESDTDED